MYDNKITSAEPTLMVFLIDQSASMSEPLAEKEGVVYTIAKVAKIISDTFLYDAFRKCMRGNVFKPYIDLAVIGYGVGIHSALPKIPLEQFPFSVTKLADTYIAENPRNPDDNSMIPKPKLEWLEERADSGVTPMLAAFTKAREIIEKWLPDHQESFPPVIINISDGMPTDDHDFIEILQQSASEYSFHLGDLSQTPLMIQSKAIRELGTNNGKCLVMNCHISPMKLMTLEYPSSSAQAEEVDPFAKFMFEMSSVIPESLFEYGIRPLDVEPPGLGMKLEPNARFFVFNAEIESVIRFMTFGSSGSLGNLSAGKKQLPD